MTDDFQFIKETRKEKPVNRKRLLHHVLETVCFAILFGAVAALTFVLLKPRFEQYFMPEEPPRVSFAETDKEKDDTSGDSTDGDTDKNTDGASDDTSDAATDGALNGTSGGDPNGAADGVANGTVDGTPNGGSNEAPEGNAAGNNSDSLDLAHYQALQNKLYAVGRQADKFIVSVTNVKNDTDMFNTTYESKGIGSGVIIANTGENLLILTEKKTIQGAASIRVTFVNDETVKAQLQQYDGNTGIAVLRVSLKHVSQETKDQIEVATLGSSVGVAQGQMVMAVGSPIGTIHSILTGNITSNRNTVSTMDCNYTIFTTDMVGSANASGVLINTDGEIIGFILQDYNMQKEQTTLAAVSISELKSVIELLSNDKPIPYLGMRISTVTDEISEDYQMPKGVYVRDVALDSPAMAAGFQSGDVITAINGKPITTAESYEKLLCTLTVEDVIHITYQRQDAEGYTVLESDARVGVLE